MGAQQLEHYLWNALQENIALARVGEDEDIGLSSVQTFEQAGVRSPYRGIVARMRDGSEYQLPLVPSGIANRA